MQKYTFILALSLSFLTATTLAAKHPIIDNISSKKCANCHEEIYQQWSGSMHAKSTALKDPIHGTFYKAVVGSPHKEGVRMGKNKDKYPQCLFCHSPAAAKEKKTKLDQKPSFAEGVNCIACHSMVKFKGTKKPGGGLQLGINAYEVSSNKIQGPNGAKKHKKFGIGGVANNPNLFRTSAACMGCHDKRNNSNAVPLCQTGSEIQSAQGSTTCQSCHMPAVNGISNHTMAGGHSAKMVAKGLLLTLDANKVGKQLRIKVNAKNQLPHSFPTGAPFRNFYIKVSATDANNKTVWQSTQSHPMKDDKQAMFVYIIGDDNNRPTSPPKATKVLGDTRLKPHETRILKYQIPASGVTKIVAKAYYDLLLVPIKEKFGKKIPADLLEPKEIAVAEFVIAL